MVWGKRSASVCDDVSLVKGFYFIDSLIHSERRWACLLCATEGVRIPAACTKFCKLCKVLVRTSLCVSQNVELRYLRVSSMTITESLRRDIFDYFEIHNFFWAGRLEETEFLSRLYTLQDMPSFDSRYENAEQDIYQHRINNNDWPDNWVLRDSRFSLLLGSDESFLRFLCESLHPVVRSKPAEVELLKDGFNLMLKDAGYELVAKISVNGRSLYAAQHTYPSTNSHFNALKGKFEHADSDYIVRQITRMESAVNDDPGLAIGTAKELVESVCKTILDERGIEGYDTLELPKLVKLTAKELKLTPPDISDSAKAVESIRRILSNLATITSGVAELRNSYGTGHGKSARTKGLGPRHGRLAIGAASTLAVFLFETHKDR